MQSHESCCGRNTEKLLASARPSTQYVENTYPATRGEAANTNHRSSRADNRDVVWINKLIHRAPSCTGLDRGNSSVRVVACRVHVAKVDRDAVSDAVGSLPRRVATRLDTERALILGYNLDRGLHIRRALRQDHAPGVLRRIGRVVGI